MSERRKLTCNEEIDKKILFKIADFTNNLIRDKEIDINEVLAEFSKILNFNKAYIFHKKDNNYIRNKRFYYPHIDKSKRDEFKSLPVYNEYGEFESYVNKFFNNECYIVKDATLIPDECNYKKYLVDSGVKSLVFLPGSDKNWDHCGFFGFEDHDTIREWNQLQLNVLQIGCNILSVLIGTYYQKIRLTEATEKYITQQKETGTLLDKLISQFKCGYNSEELVCG